MGVLLFQIFLVTLLGIVVMVAFWPRKSKPADIVDFTAKTKTSIVNNRKPTAITPYPVDEIYNDPEIYDPDYLREPGPRGHNDN